MSDPTKHDRPRPRAAGRDGDPMQRARAAALAELRRVPRARSWRRQALALWLLIFGTAALAVIGGLFGALFTPYDLAHKVSTILPLLLLQAAAVYTATAPKGRHVWPVVVAFAPVTLVAMLAARVATREPLSPALLGGWTCSASHVALALVPLGAALLFLRQIAPRPERALAAGVAIGTVGALVGELGCHHGVAHVALFHGGAWLLLIAATAFVAARLQPRTYAP